MKKFWLVLLLLTCSFQFQETAPAKDKRLTNTQKRAARRALRPLRRLSSALKVGMTLNDYKRRLPDVQADVDEALSSVPQSKARREIATAMKRFVDAREYWEMNNVVDAPEFRREIHTRWQQARQHIYNAEQYLK